MPRKFNLPLTYPPKIEPVRSGECTQTIRIINKTKAHPEGTRKEVGDLIRFFAWSGKPYRSKRVWVMEDYAEITDVLNVTLFYDYILLPSGIKSPWTSHFVCDLAMLDYISPPTGGALRDVLIGKNGAIPTNGVEAQVIRWHNPSRG